MNTTTQHTPITVKKFRDSVEAYVPGCDDETRVIWNPKKSGFMLKFKCAGRWHYQWLMWSCRAGKKSYYRPMIALYRALVGENLVSPGTLKALAH